ncbi:MAG: extracellular solute-binding protein, partial [Armatimonadota bacterium]
MRKRRASFNIHALLLGLAALVAVAGGIRFLTLRGVGSTAKTHIAFWNGFTGPDGVVMLKIIEDFNRQNPDVEVVMQRIPWATYYNKLIVACSDKRGPEIFIVHTDSLARVHRAGFMDDATDLFQKDIDIRDFDPYVAKYINFNGHYLGVPLDIHPQGLYINGEMLKKAGLVDAQGNARPPANKEEFLKAIAADTVEPKDGKDKQWWFAFTYWGANFRSLVPQFGGRFLDDKGNAAMNSGECVKALEFLQSISKEGKAP